MDGWFEFVVFFFVFGLSIVFDAKRKRSRGASSNEQVEPAKAYESVITENPARASRQRTVYQKAASTKPSTTQRPATAPEATIAPVIDKEHEALVEEVRKGIIWSEILTRKY